MYKVLKHIEIAKNIYKLVVECPLIAKKAKPGEFVIVMSYKDSERIPLTIYKYDSDTISMIYQVVGASTLELSKVKDSIYAISGPLGNASALVDKPKDNVLFVAGGIGIAPVYPQAAYLHELGYHVDIVYGAKDESSLILLDEVKEVCDNLVIATDDGSMGISGNVCDAIKTLDKTYSECVAIGPVIMMKYVSMLTKEMNLKTTVSMNPIMVDGTGMCGACRVIVGDSVFFACTDGPEFDGHKLDFDASLRRLNLYKTEEGRAYLKEKGEVCNNE